MILLVLPQLLNISVKSKEIIFTIISLNKAKALKLCLKSICKPIKYSAQYIFYNFMDNIKIICDDESGQFI